MPSASNSQNPHLAVIGAGIVGLWTAFEAARQGLKVVLFEKRTIGAGASGGLMGALMPHQPINWSAKKQFQLDGLLSLPEEIAAIEALTGSSAGYRRCGRLMPIRLERKRPFAEEWAQSSETNWPAPFRWKVLDETPDPDWLPKAEMPFGLNADNLSARVDPRLLVAALARALHLSGVNIREGSGVDRIAADGTLTCSDGSAVAAGHVVLAAGWESFGLVADRFADPLGTGVKGQAALLRPARPVDPAMPILYDDGVYVIAHDSGCVAVGSTSESAFSGPTSTDGKLDAVIEAAKALCPALAGAQIIERWAGVRPKAEGREPLVGPLPGHENLLLATGGFKISFGIAHLLARSVVAMAAGERPAFLPKAFLPENRFGRLKSSIET